MSVEPYREKLLKTILDLIEDKGVTQFYSGFRGDFDAFCSSLIFELKGCYPQIRNTMVLSYIPEASVENDNTFILPKYFDDSIYLLERSVPKRLAIIETNVLCGGCHYCIVVCNYYVGNNDAFISICGKQGDRRCKR